MRFVTCRSVTDEKTSGSVGSGRCSGGIEFIARAAKMNIHVQKTNGKVNELTLHGAITLFIAVRTQTVIAEHSTSATHTQTVLPKKVGKAHPTSTPLNPHNPCRPSSEGISIIYPVSVDTSSPSTAPHATSGVWAACAPQKIPIRKKSPLHALGWNITCPAPRSTIRRCSSGSSRRSSLLRVIFDIII